MRNPWVGAWPKPRVLWLLLFASFVLALFARYLFTSEPLIVSLAGEDIDQQYYAWRTYGFSELAAGRMPFWNPFIYGGQPYFAGFQSALLYPVTWIHFLLPTHLAINFEIAIHILLA